MARAQATRKRKKPTNKKQQGWWTRGTLKGLLYIISLFVLFMVTIGVLTYVIFFRVVVAAELIQQDGADIIFEEPLPFLNLFGENDIVTVPTGPRCAIIIDDMGYHPEIGKKLIELPFNVSFSFLPHAPYTAELEEMAYKRGRTVLLHLPLQPEDSQWDPGPGALYLGELQDQKKIFLRNLAMVPHAIGVNNHMGSLYTQDRDAMASLLDLINQKKLFFIDSYTSSRSLGYSLARQMGISAAKRNIFIDNVAVPEAICKQLEALLSVAHKKGEAIGIAHPHSQTLEALESCPALGQTSVQLVGVEELIR